MTDKIITLADGRKFNATTRSFVSEVVDVETGVDNSTKGEPKNSPSFLPTKVTAVKLEDLPGTPSMINVVGAITTYTFLGLSNSEIALALKCSLDKVIEIKQSDSYLRVQDMLNERITTQMQDSAKMILNENAHTAARKIVNLLDAKNPAIQMKAAENILDRTGIGGQANGVDIGKGLTIRLVKDKSSEGVEIKING